MVNDTCIGCSTRLLSSTVIVFAKSEAWYCIRQLHVNFEDGGTRKIQTQEIGR